MAEDWSIDVRKYAPDADESVIQGIVRHCGIALRSRDASLVSFTDQDELDRVRESFLRKKLGLTDPDDVLNAAIARVGERMKADATKNRVTVYYLLAEMFGKLALFGGAATATAAAAPAEPEAAPLVVETEPEPVVAAPEPEPVVEPVRAVAPEPSPVAAPLAAAAAPVAAAVPAATRPRPKQDDDGGLIGFGLLAAGALGAIILGTATIGSLIGTREDAGPPPVSPRMDGPVRAVPAGYGVMAETIDGKPALNIYFGTAEREVAPLGADAAALKAYIDSNPGDRLSVSGYVDPRGDRAFNEQLARDRAVNAKAALVAAGVPEDRIDLDKPADIVGGDASLAEDRRVTIRVKSAQGVVQEPAAVEKTQAVP